MTHVHTVLALFALLFLVACGGSEPERSGEARPIERALASYEVVRQGLASDAFDGLPTAARDAASAFDSAAAREEGWMSEHSALAAEAARSLAESADLDAARVRFGELSRQVIPLASAHPEGLHRFRCPMAPGFGEWVQPQAEISNPYMGTAMPTCGSELDLATVEGEHAGHGHGSGDIAYWTCSMHPSVEEAEPGQCPICSMDLTPVTTEELRSGAVLVDSVRRQRFGVKTTPVEEHDLVREVRATGAVAWDTARVVDVTLRTEAWIERAVVTEAGTPVRKGQRLATLYSPELYAAERELLAARGTALETAARARLRRFGLTAGQVEAVLERADPSETTDLLAPSSGVVIEVAALEGARVTPQAPLFRIGALDQVWVEAEVYEEDRALIAPGTPVRLSGVGLSALDAEVQRVEPWIDPATRRATVRAVVDNADAGLVPGMFVDMTLEVSLGRKLAIPTEAVVITGRRRIVFVDAGDDRLVPRDIEVGRRAGDLVEVLDGLKLGDRVVRSGNFVVAAESRIRAAETYWGGDHGTD